MSSPSPSVAALRGAFLDAMVQSAHAEGMSPICGRIFGLLVFDGGPISFSDLAQRLDVSRASISTSARALESRGLVRRIKQPGQRGVFFDLADDPYPGLLGGIMDDAARARAGVEYALDALPADDFQRRARLRDLSRFYAVLHVAMQNALTQISGDIDEPTS